MVFSPQCLNVFGSASDEDITFSLPTQTAIGMFAVEALHGGLELGTSLSHTVEDVRGELTSREVFRSFVF